LARLMTASVSTDTEAPSAPINLTASNITTSSLTLTWTASTDNVAVTAYEVYQGTTLLNGNVAATTYNVTGLSCNTNYNFTVKAKDAAGNVSLPSNTVSPTTSSCPVVTTNVIYDDIIGVGWTDISTGSTRNISNTSPVKAGTKSIRVNYSANGTLAFTKSTAVNTTATTKLDFWVYNTSNNSIKIYTNNSSGVKSPDITLKPARNKWVEVIISMGQFGNPATIQKVTIQNNSNAAPTMYFDEIKLINVINPASPSRVSGQGVQNEEVGNWKVFPNPAKDHLNVQFITMQSIMAVAELMDHTGKKLIQYSRYMNTGKNQWQIKLPFLPAGIYYLKISDGTQIKTEPIIIN
jgi:hypothetical protein